MEISLTHLNALRAALVEARAALDPLMNTSPVQREIVRSGLKLNIAQIDKHVDKVKS